MSRTSKLGAHQSAKEFQAFLLQKHIVTARLHCRWLAELGIHTSAESVDARKHARRGITAATTAAITRAELPKRIYYAMFPAGAISILLAPILWNISRDAALPRRVGAASLVNQLAHMLDQSSRTLPLIIGWALTSVTTALLAFVFIITVAGILYSLDKLRPKRLARSAPALSLLGALIAMIYFCTMTLSATSTWRLWLAASLCGTSAFYVMLLLAILIGVFYAWLDERQSISKNADGTVMLQLLSVLHDLEHRKERWYEPAFRSALMARLELAATAMERYWWRQLRSHDAATDQWIKHVCVRSAAGMRSLKKCLASPKADSRQQLSARIRGDLAAIMVGDMNSLEQTDELRRSIAIRLLRVTRTAALSFLPLALLWAVQHSAMRLEPSLSGWLSVGAYIWAVIGVLATIDPLLASKLAMLKDVRALLRASGS